MVPSPVFFEVLGTEQLEIWKAEWMTQSRLACESGRRSTTFSATFSSSFHQPSRFRSNWWLRKLLLPSIIHSCTGPLRLSHLLCEYFSSTHHRDLENNQFGNLFLTASTTCTCRSTKIPKTVLRLANFSKIRPVAWRSCRRGLTMSVSDRQARVIFSSIKKLLLLTAPSRVHVRDRSSLCS